MKARHHHHLPVAKEGHRPPDFELTNAVQDNLGRAFLSNEGRLYICAVARSNYYTFVNMETGTTWSHDGQPLKCTPVNVEITYSRL